MEVKKYEIKEGLTIFIRPLIKEDRKAFVKAFSKLSDKTKQLRFLTSTEALSEKEFDYLVNVDHENHVAFCAYYSKNGEEIGIGVARYIRSIKKPNTAEIAITIIDEFQGMGIGKLLIQNIVAFAKQHGIEKFVANAYYLNNTILNIISKYPYEITGSSDGVLTIEIDITHGKRDWKKIFS